MPLFMGPSTEGGGAATLAAAAADDVDSDDVVCVGVVRAGQSLCPLSSRPFTEIATLCQNVHCGHCYAADAARAFLLQRERLNRSNPARRSKPLLSECPIAGCDKPFATQDDVQVVNRV
jgi:hypothetical protein